MAASLTDFTNLNLTGSWGTEVSGPPPSERIGPGPFPSFYSLDEWVPLVRALRSLTSLWKAQTTAGAAEPNHHIYELNFGVPDDFQRASLGLDAVEMLFRIRVDNAGGIRVEVNTGTDADPTWVTKLLLDFATSFLVSNLTGGLIISGGGLAVTGDISVATEGDKIILDSDKDTYITASADDTPKLYIGGVEGHLPASSATAGGSGSAGAGNQYVELQIDGVIYKVLHDGTV